MGLVAFILGLAVIWLAATFVVDSGIKIARSLNLSGAFIGLTILSIGTSLPEIFMHIFASIDILNGIDASGVAVGTNIGSNMIQITFIMGFIGLLTKVRASRKILTQDYIIMLASILLLFFISLDGRVGQVEGAVIALAYVGYLFILSGKEKKLEKSRFRANYLKEGSIILFGFIALSIAANTVVFNAVKFSEIWGISGSFIGAMMIGVTTALPELTTALIGILRGSPGISLGTLVGSNITNPMFSLGIGAAISGYSIEKTILFYDIPFWFFGSLVPLFFFWNKKYLDKWQALAMIGIYVTYGWFRFRFL